MNTIELIDQNNRFDKNPIVLNVDFDKTHGQLWIGANGYTDHCSNDNEGFFCGVEKSEGVLRLVVWADINDESPTHIIELDKAKNSNREQK